LNQRVVLTLALNALMRPLGMLASAAYQACRARLALVYDWFAFTTYELHTRIIERTCQNLSRSPLEISWTCQTLWTCKALGKNLLLRYSCYGSFATLIDLARNGRPNFKDRLEWLAKRLSGCKDLWGHIWGHYILFVWKLKTVLPAQQRDAFFFPGPTGKWQSSVIHQWTLYRLFHFHRVAFAQQLRNRVGLTLTKETALRITPRTT
jgi:hypothetical protein